MSVFVSWFSDSFVLHMFFIDLFFGSWVFGSRAFGFYWGSFFIYSFVVLFWILNLDFDLWILFVDLVFKYFFFCDIFFWILIFWYRSLVLFESFIYEGFLEVKLRISIFGSYFCFFQILIRWIFFCFWSWILDIDLWILMLDLMF